MSALRRRAGNVPEPESSPETPTNNNPDNDGDSGNPLHNVRKEVRRIEVPVFKKRSKRRNGFIFGLGGLFGVFIALFFANHNEVISFDALMDLNLDSLIDVIPAGMVRDAKEFTVWAILFSLCAFCGRVNPKLTLYNPIAT